MQDSCSVPTHAWGFSSGAVVAVLIVLQISSLEEALSSQIEEPQKKRCTCIVARVTGDASVGLKVIPPSVG